MKLDPQKYGYVRARSLIITRGLLKVVTYWPGIYDPILSEGVWILQPPPNVGGLESMMPPLLVIINECPLDVRCMGRQFVWSGGRKIGEMHIYEKLHRRRDNLGK